MKFAIKKAGMASIAGALALLGGAASAKDVTLGFVAASMQYPYDHAIAKSFQEAAKELGAKAIVLDPKGSVEKQGNSIDDLITQKVDGIAIIPLDSIVAKTWVDQATENNISFVAAAAQVGDPDKVPMKQVYAKLSALVTTDDIAAAELAGELAAKYLPKGRTAKIGIVEGSAGYAVVRQRNQGFKQGLEKSGVKYQILASQPTDWTPQKGESVCQNMLTSHPDLDLIFSQADDMAIGCAKAIRATNSKAKLVATGGGSRQGNDAISKGEMDGSVCTNPTTIGRLTAKALFEAATNKNTPKARFITYKTPVVTKATLAECPNGW